MSPSRCPSECDLPRRHEPPSRGRAPGARTTGPNRNRTPRLPEFERLPPSWRSMRTRGTPGFPRMSAMPTSCGPEGRERPATDSRETGSTGQGARPVAARVRSYPTPWRSPLLFVRTARKTPALFEANESRGKGRPQEPPTHSLARPPESADPRFRTSKTGRREPLVRDRGPGPAEDPKVPDVWRIDREPPNPPHGMHSPWPFDSW